MNLAIKILVAKRTMQNAEKLGLPNEQLGGRKKRSTSALGLDNLLTIDYAHLTNSPMGVVDLDATVCYDRITRSIGILALMKFGLSREVVLWLLQTFDSMQHYNLVNNRVSTESHPISDTPSHGEGQGLTWAGGAWVRTDSLITDDYRKKASLATITCPDKPFSLEKNSTAFVDDRKLWVNGGTYDDIRSKIYDNTVQIRSNLHETGGDINISKSAWCICPVAQDDEERMSLQRMPSETAKIDDALDAFETIRNALTTHELSLAIGMDVDDSATIQEVLDQIINMPSDLPR